MAKGKDMPRRMARMLTGRIGAAAHVPNRHDAALTFLRVSILSGPRVLRWLAGLALELKTRFRCIDLLSTEKMSAPQRAYLTSWCGASHEAVGFASLTQLRPSAFA